MLTILTIFMAGALAGGLLVWLVSHLASRTARPDHFTLGHEVDEHIRRGAQQWAAQHGRSDTAAGLVADKLRLNYVLHQRRAHRQRRWRWSR